MLIPLERKCPHHPEGTVPPYIRECRGALFPRDDADIFFPMESTSKNGRYVRIIPREQCPPTFSNVGGHCSLGMMRTYRPFFDVDSIGKKMSVDFRVQRNHFFEREK